MAETFTIEVHERGASLTLREHDRQEFVAQLRHLVWTLARESVVMFGGLADFLAGLAENWKGWKGLASGVARRGVGR